MKGFDANIRIEEWCKILGIEGGSLQLATFWATPTNKRSASEIRVIEQDVIRTRQDEEFYKTFPLIDMMKSALISYCNYYECEYMQGLNEIMAVMISIDQITNNFQNDISRMNICFRLFEKFIERLAPVTFSTKGVQALQIQLFYFHSLLCYHAPELWYFLEAEGMSIDIYATAWFVTLYSRRSPVHVVLHLWDLLLQSNRPHLILHVAVAFLMWNERLIRGLNKEMLPETLVRLALQAPDDVDKVFHAALQLECSTPNSVIDSISRLAFDPTLPQSVRSDELQKMTEHRTPYLQVSADDVAAVLMNQGPSAHAPEGPPMHPGPEPGGHAPGSTRSYRAMHFLLLDCRVMSTRRFFIESSVPIPPEVAMELAAVTYYQSRIVSQDQTHRTENSAGPASKPLLELVVGQLSTVASSTLSLLWTCISMDVHFAVADDDKPYPHHQKPAAMTPAGTPTDTTSVQNAPPPDLKYKSSTAQHGGILPPSTTSHSSAGLTTAARLAFALIQLGFPRVSVVRGEGLPSAPAALPPALEHLGPSLTSPRDGISALAFRLWLRGCHVSSVGVLHVPEDAVLAHKARKFVDQMTAKKSDGGDRANSNKRISNLDRQKNFGNSNSKLVSDTQISQARKGIMDFTFLPQLPNLYSGLSLSSIKPTVGVKEVSQSQGLGVEIGAPQIMEQLHFHSRMQSVHTGKIILNDVRYGTSSTSSVTSQMEALRLRCSLLRSQSNTSLRCMNDTKLILDHKINS